MKPKIQLDAIDWHILAELQADGRITNVELAKRVGISAPPCLRRVRNLEERGIILGYHARLDHKALGISVLAYAMVGLSSQSEADLQAFIEAIDRMPEVLECHMLSGEIDFLLKCQTPDLESFQDFIINVLTALPNVDSVKTSLTIKQCKSLPGIDIATTQQSQKTH